MVEIIEAEADDLAGARDRQRVFEPFERTARLRLGDLDEIGERCERALGPAQHFAQVAGEHAVHRLQVDDGIALDHAQLEPAIRFEADDFHEPCPGAFVQTPGRDGRAAQGLMHFRVDVKCRFVRTQRHPRRHARA